MTHKRTIRNYIALNWAIHLKIAQLFYYIVTTIVTKLSGAFKNSTTLCATLLHTFCTFFVLNCFRIIFNMVFKISPLVDFQLSK